MPSHEPSLPEPRMIVSHKEMRPSEKLYKSRHKLRNTPQFILKMSTYLSNRVWKRIRIRIQQQLWFRLNPSADPAMAEGHSSVNCKGEPPGPSKTELRSRASSLNLNPSTLRRNHLSIRLCYNSVTFSIYRPGAVTICQEPPISNKIEIFSSFPGIETLILSINWESQSPNRCGQNPLSLDTNII